MRLAEHIINYIVDGLKLPEMVRGLRSPKQFRKFKISDDLFYFVHDSGYVLLGKTLITAGRPPRDILRDIAKYENFNHTVASKIGV